LREPFDIGEELVAALLCVLERASALFYIHMPSNKPQLQRLAGNELRAKTIKNFKEASRQQKDIENRLEFLKSVLEHGYLQCEDMANKLDNPDSSHGE
jgi:hypothetical protein